ncbi:MAG: Asp-tRNA(Asn)/Glu-tRNA(Gln) amidotransferase subunit GatC [Desulfovibrio sp.]|jgi:aspartyl-tRNA(Asn)/glutamyl-tRNA(Gln) amidotransferase subunit C|nr:Asp-tRNA(Asn)/Glu-tRNA(Gln) amidotransferase subunit GatC [Desulfovibrio sp.]
MSEQKTVTQDDALKDDVLKMASLSRLQTDGEEQSLFARQFRDILDYMDTLASVDTEDVEPLYTPALHGGMPRDDVSVPGIGRGEALRNAPRRDGEYFIVPRIV